MNWSHASAQQLKRVPVDSDRNNAHVLTCADEVLAQCEVCQGLGVAPHVPAAGASTVAMFNEKLQVALLYLDDVNAQHVMAVFPKYSPLIPSRTKNPQEGRDAFCGFRAGVFGPPLSIQMEG